MGLDPRILLSGRGVQAPDPIEMRQRALSLAAIARQGQMQEMAMRQKQQQDEEAQALRGVLGELHAADFSPQAVQMALQRAPMAAPAIVKAAQDAQKAREETRYKGAQAGDLEERTRKTRMERAGAIANFYAGRPNLTPEDVARAQQNAQSYGINPEIFAVPEGVDPREHFRAIAQGSIGADKQAELAGQAEGRQITLRGQDVSAQTQRRGQDMTAQSAAESRALTRRGQDMVNARAREANAATGGKWVNDLDRGVQVNMATGETRPITAAGQPVGPRVDKRRAGMSERALAILDQAEPLIRKATGSYAGAGVDAAAGAVGLTLPGAAAAQELKVLEAALMMNQPRMEGPQSDKDVALYQRMAGQIGDPTVPEGHKLAAVRTIRQLHEKYAEIEGGTAAPARAQGAQAGAPSGGGRYSVGQVLERMPDPASLPVGTIVKVDGRVEYVNNGSSWQAVRRR